VQIFDKAAKLCYPSEFDLTNDRECTECAFSVTWRQQL